MGTTSLSILFRLEISLELSDVLPGVNSSNMERGARGDRRPKNLFPLPVFDRTHVRCMLSWWHDTIGMSEVG